MASHHLLSPHAPPFLLPFSFPSSSSPRLLFSSLPNRNHRNRGHHLPTPSLHLSSASATAAATTSVVALGDFWQWLADNGAVDPARPPARPAAAPEGIGLVAERDIARGEVVAEVPKKLWIDADTVAASELGRLCGGIKPWVAVALFILREKARGGDSNWRPYLDILPNETDSTIFWSEEELAEIQGTQLLSTTMGVKEYVQSEFAQVESEIISANKNLFPGTVTLDDFLWAFGIMRSRVFSRMRGESLALIPFADLINHDAAIVSEDSPWEIKSKGLFGREQVFSLRTLVPVKSGEQVYMQYDLAKSNAELALDYGFIESNSEREAYTLTLEIPESDPFYGDKLDIAESNGLGESAYFDVGLGRSLPPQLLPYLRLVSLGGTDAFLLESIFRNTVWGHLELPVSRDNEESICKAVRDACNVALSSYQTTIEEDEELMNNGNLNSRLRIAVGVRAGEKKVLQQIDDIFGEREQELDGLEYYQERRLKDLGLVGDNGDIIFWESQ